MPFTAAELEAMRIADAEIEREFKPWQAHKDEITAYQKAYYEAQKRAAQERQFLTRHM